MSVGVTIRCRFSTERLVAENWRRQADRLGIDLVDAVSSLLTRSTTRDLPTNWQGDFDRDRASRWIAERDDESPTLLVVDRETSEAIGLVILFETNDDDDPLMVDVRLGYVLGEAFWGRGLASELVGGLVRWAEGKPEVGSVTGGVSRENAASARVLVKNGFSPVEEWGAERLYRLEIQSADRERRFDR